MKSFYFLLLASTVSGLNIFGNFKRATCDVQACIDSENIIQQKCGDSGDPQCFCDLPDSYFQDVFNCLKNCGNQGNLGVATSGGPSAIKSAFCELATGFTFNPTLFDTEFPTDFATDFASDFASDFGTDTFETETTNGAGNTASGTETVSETANANANSGSASKTESGSGSGSGSKTSASETSSKASSETSSKASSESTSHTTTSTSTNTNNSGAGSIAVISFISLVFAMML
ncbi:hypothetical protein G210_1933 [Candida maltosa Xu316]|uniref:Extracellular membrane protein CFEM domain-containing protein n=1 Tax=Candida maltosa (strain Xu316) TaxID=1245528 RepID=M3J6I7_CANMX|nr:hypothetical protein G210_1933 [Candida maltosa Xu316]